ncbi:chlorophyll synthesis pathway protein BchC [Altererythrobacter lutimaris]|uniref:Chlorophyll synthesis pathway protein BchC n=1 Tax=Altererythrobacter lutimaris TaxID=2743979 RepID=A0A850HCF3_9SPHN|nr:chlorophyll synthesis pathway protein BchC [Altererythrobacter lutimaris]NVE94985.1 chlorophyll synthesis pathway protein BchC [Altererythrobacter lutimaris]
MDALAVLMEAPKQLALKPVTLTSLGSSDVLVETHWSGISTGTEKLLYTGQMPDFPGMGYPLVPGYETVGRIIDAGPDAVSRIGEWVFVPGASCYENARGLFGGSAQRLIVPSARAFPVSESLAESGVLIALAATAHHALAGGQLPELIVGHGVLGRLMARMAIALCGEAPTVWDTAASRREGAQGYEVLAPEADERRDYSVICDVSGSTTVLDDLIARLARQGEIVLAGFYSDRVNFAFPAAFQKEARMRIAAEWAPEDLTAVLKLIDDGALSLEGLVSNSAPVADAAEAYPKAFHDADCLKMVLDWRDAT